jgi:hypothetical protein
MHARRASHGNAVTQRTVSLRRGDRPDEAQQALGKQELDHCSGRGRTLVRSWYALGAFAGSS